MALLDVLSVVFDADATKLKKGAGEAEKVIEETKDTVVNTDKAAENLGDTFLDTIGSAKAAITGLFGLGAITAAVVSQAAATDQLGKFSETIGVNIEDVGAWGEAVARSGGSMEGFQGSLSSLTDNLTDLALTGGGPAAEAFAKLGIQASDSSGKIKSAFEILPEIAASFEGLSAAESVALGQKLGLDQSTILLLQQSGRSIDDVISKQKKLGVATQEDYKIAADFNTEWDNTKQVFNSLARETGSKFLPIFQDIFVGVQGVVKFLRDNRDIVTGFFIGAAAAVTAFFLPAMLSTVISIAPLIAVGAAVLAVGTAFSLIYDDIQNFIQGNDSLTGKIAERWPFIIDLVKFLISVFKGLFVILSDIGVFLAGTFIEIVKSVFGFASDLITGFLDGIQGAFNLFGKIKNAIGLGDKDKETDITKAAQNAEKAIEQAEQNPLSGQSAQSIAATIEAIKKSEMLIEQAEQNPLSGQSAQSIAATSNSINRSTSVSVGAVNVDARGGDSGEISKGIGTALKDEMNATVSNYDDGIAY